MLPFTGVLFFLHRNATAVYTMQAEQNLLICNASILTFFSPVIPCLRRQMQCPYTQYQALLDTMVITETGARFQLLEVVTQV